MKHNLNESLKVHHIFKSDSYAVAADQDSVTIDLKDLDELLLIFNYGDIAATGVTTWVLRGSDDDSTYADITGSGFDFLQTASENDKSHLVRVNARQFNKRYLKLRYTQTNDAAEFGVIGIATARELPVTHSAKVVEELALVLEAGPVAG